MDYFNLIWCLDTSYSLPKQDHDDFVLYSAIILEHTWWVRNEFYFKETQFSLETSMQIVRNKFQEYKHAFKFFVSDVALRTDEHVNGAWIMPLRGSIKINSYAVVR